MCVCLWLLSDHQLVMWKIRPVAQEHHTQSSQTSIQSVMITFAAFRLHQNPCVSSFSHLETHTGVAAAGRPYVPYPDSVSVHRIDTQLCNRWHSIVCVYTASTPQSMELLERLCQTGRSHCKISLCAASSFGSVWQCASVKNEEDGGTER